MPPNRADHNSDDRWPFPPRFLSELVPTEVVLRLLTGMSERLKAPVVLFERNPDAHVPFCIHYPGPYDAKEPRSIRFRYPRFCLLFQDFVADGQKRCEEDSRKRVKDILDGKPETDNIQQCHMGLTISMKSINLIPGRPLAVCTSGKFLRKEDLQQVQEKLDEFESNKMVTRGDKNTLYDLAKEAILQDDMVYFNRLFDQELKILHEVVLYYWSHHRGVKEWKCREQINTSLFQAGDEPEELRRGLEQALSYLRSFLGVRYLAIFLAMRDGDRVLSLLAQDGLSWEEVKLVQFNWRKAELPPVREGSFNTSEWLEQMQYKLDFPKEIINKGVRGPGKEHFLPGIYLLPAGRQYRGVLLVGDWLKATRHQSLSSFGGRQFLQSIGQLILTQAIAKRAVHASRQHDRNRDLIVALTSHSIRAAVHKAFDQITLIKKAADQQDNIIKLLGKLEENMRVMGRNIEISMEAPGTALIPDIHETEMVVEPVNIGVLIHNCCNMFDILAKDKQINIDISEDIESLPMVQGDRYMLELVFSNIIDNAIKYSKLGKEVRIKSKPIIASLKYDSIEIEISDLGIGIPKVELDRIFDKGYRSAVVGGSRRRGVGLGLYQARKLVEMHGGVIWAQSHPIRGDDDWKNHVVSFFVRLPLRQQKKS
jgi:signal transduction histidine kinase